MILKKKTNIDLNYLYKKSKLNKIMKSKKKLFILAATILLITWTSMSIFNTKDWNYVLYSIPAFVILGFVYFKILK